MLFVQLLFLAVFACHDPALADTFANGPSCIPPVVVWVHERIARRRSATFDRRPGSVEIPWAESVLLANRSSSPYHRCAVHVEPAVLRSGAVSTFHAHA